MKSQLALAMLVAAALPGAAAAQYVMMQPSLYLGPQISFRDHVAAQDRGREARAARSSTDPAETVAALTYRHDPARSRRNLDGYITRLAGGNAASEAELRGLLDDSFFGKIEALAKPRGLQVNNVADAYAVWWIVAWKASQGRNDDPTPASLRAVQRQAAAALAVTPQMRAAGDVTKQELAESLWVQGVMLDLSVDQAKSDPARLKAVGDAAISGARTMGLDLRAMRLTDAGFVPV